ncbi:response regulator transcription factor [Paraburkholderia acidisoli]|uniref:Response regulator n=1 Tax=Paraburkholderia acidisoli TaxID=2571748 RepID=A0A7Z2JJ38_9BURK|nr:response regulator [Paraburkholderia acidisoli]QGZ64970.1 response regulator [Paraburkholderia acidisoli]
MTTPVVAIVDDDAFVREAMGQLVRSFDFAVELYASGRDLLGASAPRRIDCVITDLHMPEMNGFAICEQLRLRGLAVPVILMTAFAKDGDEARAKALGATCFLNKPFQDTDILRCLEHALGLDRSV